MNIAPDAKREIKALAKQIGNGAIGVSFHIGEGGFIRVDMSCPGTKGDQFEFDRIGRSSKALADVVDTARRRLRSLKDRSDARRASPLGEKLQEAFAKTQPTPTPPIEDPMPDHDTLPVKEMRLPKVPKPIEEPGTRIKMKNIEVARSIRYWDMIGDQNEKDGTYTYLPGYSDESVRALVCGEIKIECYTRLRRETVGKLPTELRLNKDQQIAKLTARVAELEAEIAELRSARKSANGTKAPTLHLPA